MSASSFPLCCSTNERFVNFDWPLSTDSISLRPNHSSTQLSPATVNACLRELEKLGIVKEITGQKRNRLYSYVEYIQIMNEGTELPP
jgi:Fe2+ or Zn2+ uptake regulation protein